MFAFFTGNERAGAAPARRRRGFDPAAGRDGSALERRELLSADVLTYHNDNARTGQNLDETVLTPANVNAGQFGKVGQVAVDGQVYAQPLYESNVAIPGQGTHDVVFVATENDSVYAFDAHSLALLWHVNFTNPAAGITPGLPRDLKNETNIAPVVGITGTPVIDPATGTLYAVAMTREAHGRRVSYVQRLHALDVGTGAEKFGGPTVIQASVPGRGTGAAGGRVRFSAQWDLQRPALLLDNGVVTVTWASFNDKGPYHGWVLGYGAQTLRLVSAFNDTPNGSEGGIWMAGGAPAADSAHNVFLATGNGTFDANRRGGRDYGDTVMKLQGAFGPSFVADYFTPFNQNYLQANDLDIGSSGVVLLPDQPGPVPHLLVAGAKDGRLFLINRDNMGRYSTTADNIVQEISGQEITVTDTPAYFNGAVYVVGTGTRAGTNQATSNILKSFPVVNGMLGAPTVNPTVFKYPGSTPSISANGTADGIVWTLDNVAGAGASTILRAFDANDVTHELYDSTQAGTRDQGGPGVKFTVPTVADGHVYIGGAGTLTVYGLLNTGG